MKRKSWRSIRCSIMFSACLGASSVGWAENPPTEEEELTFKALSSQLETRVKELEEKHDTPKLLAISGDLDFLEELVFSDDKAPSIFKKESFDGASACLGFIDDSGLKALAIYGDKTNVVTESEGVTKTEVKESSFSSNAYQAFLSGGQRRVVYRKGDETVKPNLRCRLELIEKQLFKSSDLPEKKGKALKERVDEVYTELNFENWQNENLRFGANVGYMKDLGVQTASVAFHVFPSYRRHTPGNLDLWRRTSFYLGLGNVFSGSGDVDVESAVLSAGIGVELIRGVSLNYGTSVFDSEDGETKTHEREDTISFSLRSEFWSSLFNNDGQAN